MTTESGATPRDTEERKETLLNTTDGSFGGSFSAQKIEEKVYVTNLDLGDSSNSKSVSSFKESDIG